MLAKSTQDYCYSITNSAKLTGAQLVGVKALNLQRLLQGNVVVPAGFVISGKAFDDFLIQNNLVETLVDLLDELSLASGSRDEPNYERFSREIQEQILAAEMPVNISTAIVASYRRLAQYSDAFVTVSPSPLTQNLEHLGVAECSYYNLRGDETLLDSVRQVWADLFTASELQYRARAGYEGSLTQPVLVQRAANAEASGLVYNFNLGDRSTTQATVIALLGEAPLTTALLERADADYYLAQKLKPQVDAKLTNQQRFMGVRTNHDPEAPVSKVKVSKLWSAKQKLDEIQLRKLINILNLIEEIWSERLEVKWVLDSGEFKILDVLRLPDTELDKLPRVNWGKTTTKEELLSSINLSDETELALPEPDRDQKAESVSQMLPEIKTATDVWWQTERSASELRIFSQVFDGFGVLDLADVVATVQGKRELESLKRSQNLQKSVCDYLALYLKAVAPKPVLISLVKSAELGLETQLSIFSQVRNLYGHRNFWLLLPEVERFSDISRTKRVLTANGFRRTSNFKVFQMVSQPLLFDNLDLVGKEALDGVVIAAERLVLNALGGYQPVFNSKDQSDSELYVNSILAKLAEISKLKLYVLLAAETPEFREQLLEKTVASGVDGILYTGDDLPDFKTNLAELEAENLTKDLRKLKKSAASL